MAGSDGEGSDERNERLDRASELAAALLLSLAALLSSYASLQADLWDGEQATHYALAEQGRTYAARSATLAGEVRIFDTLLFSQWLNARADSNQRLEAFYRSRFRPEFSHAFDEWAAGAELIGTWPKTPMAMPSYAPAIDRERRSFEQEADRRFRLGQDANATSDAYQQAVMMLAMALFIGGIVQAFDQFALRVALIAVAALCCLAGGVRLVALPALSPG